MSAVVTLTDEQRARIEAEVAYAEALARAASSKKTILEYVSAIFAHPAFVTVLGSGLLALIVSHYQQVATAEEHNAEHARQIREKRLSIASGSIADFDRSGLILINLQILKSSMASNKYPHNMSREEASSIYKSLIEKYMAQTHRFATVAQLASWFGCDSGVLTKVGNVDKTFKDFEALEPKDITGDELKKFQIDSEKELGELSNAMVAAVEPKGKCY
jgi:hypothetical protein